MPTCRLILAVTLLVVVFSSTTPNFGHVGPSSLMITSMAAASSSGLKSVLDWLANNQSSDGSYGVYSQATTPAASYALWLNDSHSAKAHAAYSWLASQLDNPSSYAWGEADIPGQVIYTLSKSDSIGLLRNSSDILGLLSYQQPNGGFLGYYDLSGSQTTSSVDTAMALLGLEETNAISPSKQQSAISYLLSLQNENGSFNLTRSEAKNQYDALGPDPISVTAQVVLVLKKASFSTSNSHVSEALGFLSRAVSNSFKGLGENKGHVYAAALSALAFDAFGQAEEAASSIEFLVSNQNSDGGFRDVARFSPGSNVLDSGWAAVALQLVLPVITPSAPLLTPLAIFAIIVGVSALVAGIGVVVYLVRKNRLRAVPSLD